MCSISRSCNPLTIPRPNGLAWDDVVEALRMAIGSGHAAGLQVAIYNPDIDADGSNGRGLAATIRTALATKHQEAPARDILRPDNHRNRRVLLSTGFPHHGDEHAARHMTPRR